MSKKRGPERVVREIKRKTRRRFSAEEKIRIVLEGLKGEEIPLGARIVGVIDAWIAMTSNHPWRRALSHRDAIKEIKKAAGTQFDPRIVEAFLHVVDKKPIPV